MWLKIFYDKDDIPEWLSKEPVKINVALDEEKSVPVPQSLKSFRVSPIFPLDPTSNVKDINNTKICFYNFPNAYRVLGRIQKLGSDALKNAVFFSCGLSSVIIIASDESLTEEFFTIVKYKYDAVETWEIKDSILVNVTPDIVDKDEKDFVVNVANYEMLPLAERATIDEFKVSIHLLLLKMQSHMPSELDKIQKLIEEMNVLIEELVFLSTFLGEVPDGLSEYSVDELKNKKNGNMIKHQNLDRIIQVNSALSYVSTQAFSGAIPILERRSLIRRNSLLGIGSAILALNNIARFIESCFSKLPIEDVIIKGMNKASNLDGLEVFYDHNPETWFESSVSTFTEYTSGNDSYFKLPYFNGRLGFRETEYSIAAAIQSISSGATLEWSLMTLTHEMLHGHVRDIMTFIFYGGDKMTDDNLRDKLYENFSKKIMGKKINEKLIDSVRRIIFTYCCFTDNHGSITSKKNIVAEPSALKLLSKDQLWNVFEREYRNINEIFVHILDLHYFYSSRVAVYIPLIWCSWLAVPYVGGDLRQYILRSILTIASKEDGTVFSRFNTAVSRLLELLSKYKDGKLNHPIITDVLSILDDKNTLMTSYFPAFKSSLIVVDMINKIFTSEAVRASIFADELVAVLDDERVEDTFERIFEYNLPDGFNDEIIKSPISYLLNKMISELNSEIPNSDIERETTLQFLALNSN